MNIDHTDIARLVREPSAAQRSLVAEKICVGFNSGQFSDAESRLAADIFRLLLKDTELRVRRVLADQLKQNLHVPHDIIWTLANDKPEVATSVLQYSFVLSEEDLIAIVKASKNVTKLRAIAQRQSISKPLSRVLLEKRDRDVAYTLLANRSAMVDEADLELVLELFSSEQSILEELVYRGGLPHTFAERLFYKVSGNLRKQITQKYRLNATDVDEAAQAARETVTLQFLAPWLSHQDMGSLVSDMQRAGRLTDSIIMRSLCIGDIRFFETSLAMRAGVSPANARVLIADPGPLGFKSLYTLAKMPEGFFECVRVLLQLANSETQFGTYQTQDYCNRMIAAIIAGGYDKTIEHMDVMLTMIGMNLSNDLRQH
jgi:uncharacterized protein (DUF2336 family)